MPASQNDLRLEFNAWFKSRWPNQNPVVQEIAWSAYREGNAKGFNDGASFGAQLEGGE